MKLVKNRKIIRLPKAKRGVKQVIRNASLAAEREGWHRIIVIGEGKDVVRSMYSDMDAMIAVGMLELEKAINIRDIGNS